MHPKLLQVVVAGRCPRERDWLAELVHGGCLQPPQVHFAESGADALLLLREHAPKPCLLLAAPVDDMPAIDLLARLAGPDGLSICPVVLVTAGDGREQGPELLRAGAQDYLGETWVSPHGLARAIDNAQVRWAMERALRQRDAELQAEIEDRQRVEDELRLAKQRFETALAASPVIVFNQDRGLRYTWIHNPPAGLSPSDFLGRRDTQILERPQDARRAEALKRMAMRGARLHRREVSVLHQGLEYHFDLTLQPQYDAHGDMVGVTGAAVDITARLRERAELKAGRRQLALAVQVGGLAVGEIDYTTGQMQLSAEMARLFEMGDAPQTLPLSAVHATIHPDDRPRVLQALAKSKHPVEGGGLDLKYRLHRPGAPLRWLRLRSQVLFSGEGPARQPSRAVVAALDITAEHEALVALQRSEAFARGVLDALPEQVLVLDRRGIVQAENESWRRFAREQGGAMAGTSIGADYLQACRNAGERGELDTAALVPTLQAVLDGHSADCEFECAWRTSGGLRWLLVHARGRGQGEGLVFSQIDITARKLAEEHARGAQQLMQAVLDGAGTVLFAKDRQGRYLLTSRAWRDRAGCDEQQAAGATDEAVFGPLVARVVRHTDLEILATGRRVVAEETSWSQGQPMTCLASKFPLTDPDGKRFAVGGVSTDITNLKRAQAQLQARERDLQALADNAPDVLLRFDRQLRYVFANAAIKRLIGRDPQDVIGLTNRELGIAPVLCEAWDQAILAALCEARPQAIGFDLDSPLGLRHIAARFVPEFNPAGQVDRVLAVLHDDTERQRAEQALRRSEEQFRMLADHMGHLAWIADSTGAVFWVNRRWIEFAGTAHASFGNGWHGLAHPNHARRVRERFAHCVGSGETWEDCIRMRRHDGRYAWFLSRAVPLRARDGQITRWFGTHTEAAGHFGSAAEIGRLLEQERRHNRLLVRMARASQRLHACLAAEDIARVLTEEAREILWAHQAAAVFAPHARAGQAFRAVSLSDKYAAWQPDCDALAEAPAAEQVPNGKPPGPIRLSQAQMQGGPGASAARLLVPGGPPMRGWLSVPLTGPRGEVLGLLQVSDRHEGDFTEHDQAMLVQLAAIASGAFDKAGLCAHLRESDHRKDEFVAILAHELRNPLAPIRNGLEILRRGGQLVGPAARARDMMERQLAHMVRLVDDLLDISRITRGKMVLRRERIALQSVLEYALESTRPAMDEGGHRLVLQVPGEPLWIDGDLTRLAQAVSNLLNNAAKYTPRSGRIEVTIRVEGALACLRVADNGAGISPDMLPRVFDLFTQVDRTLPHAQGGLGIGLSLVKQLVELHQGQVEAQSDGVGRGSCFVLRLPRSALHEPASSAIQGPAAASQPAGPKAAAVQAIQPELAPPCPAPGPELATATATTKTATGIGTHIDADIGVGPSSGMDPGIAIESVADIDTGSPIGDASAFDPPPTGGPNPLNAVRRLQAPRRRVLVVDDNIDAAESLATVLRLRGHHVQAVHNGFQALLVASQIHPEVVLLDIGLPGISGHEVARRMRQNPLHAGVLLVAVTGWGTQEDRRQSAEAGFDLHLTKPVDAAELESVLAGWLPAAGVPDPGSRRDPADLAALAEPPSAAVRPHRRASAGSGKPPDVGTKASGSHEA